MISSFCLRITSRSPLGKDTLSLNPGLVRRHGPILANRVFPRVPAIACGSILNQEGSPISRGNLQAETFQIVIPPYRVTAAGQGSASIERFVSLQAGIVRGTRWLPRVRIGSQKNATLDTAGND